MMEKTRLKRNVRTGGFTLIEAMTAVFVTGLIILFVMTVFLSSVNNYYIQDTTTSANRSAELGMEYIARDLRSTKSILLSYGGNTTSSSGAVLKSPSYNGSGIISDTYDYISYKVNNQQNLLRTTISGGGSRVNETDRVLATHINSISMTYTCLSEFHGNGTSTTFTIAHSWINTPTVSVNGVEVTSGYNIDLNNLTITFGSAPSSGDVIEVSYAVSPYDSSALSDVQAVRVQLSSQTSYMGKVKTASLDTFVRLRNKR